MVADFQDEKEESVIADLHCDCDQLDFEEERKRYVVGAIGVATSTSTAW